MPKKRKEQHKRSLQTHPRNDTAANRKFSGKKSYVYDVIVSEGFTPIGEKQQSIEESDSDAEIVPAFNSIKKMVPWGTANNVESSDSDSDLPSPSSGVARMPTKQHPEQDDGSDSDDWRPKSKKLKQEPTENLDFCSSDDDELDTKPRAHAIKSTPTTASNSSFQDELDSDDSDLDLKPRAERDTSSSPATFSSSDNVARSNPKSSRHSRRKSLPTDRYVPPVESKPKKRVKARPAPKKKKPRKDKPVPVYKDSDDESSSSSSEDNDSDDDASLLEDKDKDESSLSSDDDEEEEPSDLSEDELEGLAERTEKYIDEPLEYYGERKAKRSNKPNSFIVDSSDEEEEEEVLPPLTKKEKLEKLSKIEKPVDRVLQALLWSLEFRFTLLPHQFEGVRNVAGVRANFPLHDQSHGEEANAALADNPLSVSIQVVSGGLDGYPKTRGMLLCDDMGLGKTIEAIGGAIIRNGLSLAQGREVLPSVVIAPNRAVLSQWTEALNKNGVKNSTIWYIDNRRDFDSGSLKRSFILMTKDTLCHEVKHLLHEVNEDEPLRRVLSPLFPEASVSLLQKLRNQKRAGEGKELNRFKRDGEFVDDCITRLIRDKLRMPIKAVVSTLIIDEAHFLRNRKAFWGIGATLMGIHSERNVCLTGTPYSNNNSDLAAIMSYADVGHDAAKTWWWNKATSSSTALTIIEKVSSWREEYLLRRTKEAVLSELLPKKTVTSHTVTVYNTELFVYAVFEERLSDLMIEFARLQETDTPYAIAKQKELFTILMALFTLLRGCLIHPMLPNGREITIRFSPSRRHLLAAQEKPDVCVCCNKHYRPTVLTKKEIEKKQENEKKNAPKSADTKPAGAGNPTSASSGGDAREGHLDLDDAGLKDDEVEFLGEEDDDEEEDKGELVPLPAHICAHSDGPVRHFAHEKCLEDLHSLFGEMKCPRCLDMIRRSQLCDSSGTPSTRHKTYCEHISVVPGGPGGFKASTKLQQVVDWYEQVPKDDKVLILSFYKGGLDVLEGIFQEDMGIDCARFDGDVADYEKRLEELNRFKTSASCRILFATVHSGGTGLNIAEANHVLFLDRWFNPTVHDQAMDRCYRIGQTKDVEVAFFDCQGTIDDAMMMLNAFKRDNARVLLADGSDLGNAGGDLNFRQLGGVMGRLLQATKQHRTFGPDGRVVSTTAEATRAKLGSIIASFANGSSSRRRVRASQSNEEGSS